jgi:hypothetical protein
MGFLDGVSSGLGEWSKSSLNAQFGGGCPICKGINTLDRRSEGGRFLLVCGKCGAAFQSAVFNGLTLVRGDRRYRDQTLPVGVWRIIRFLPAEDRLLASYSKGHVTFYATLSGVIRIKGSEATLLKYSDIKDISPAVAWMHSVYHLIGALLFFFVGAVSVLLSLATYSLVGFAYSAVFFFLSAAVILFSRQDVYQFDSQLLSKKELRDWRIRKPKSKDAEEFVSLVSAHLSSRSS